MIQSFKRFVKTIFLKLYLKVYLHEIRLASKQKDLYNFFLVHTKLNLLQFRASDSVVPIQSGDTRNIEETSYFTAGIALHQMFKSVARFVNAAIK